MRVLLTNRDMSARWAAVIAPIQAEHLLSARTDWVVEIERQADAGRHNDDALLWEKQFLADAECVEPFLLGGHVVVREGRVEGVLVTSKAHVESRLEPGRSLTYVRYLATAPWNRDGVNLETGYLGIGRLLAARAVLDSMARGEDGRIDLHALPGARSFYSHLGFCCLGIDPAHRGLPYFELPRGAVFTVLAELGTRLDRESAE